MLADDRYANWGAYTPSGSRKIWITLGQSTPLGRGSLRRYWVKRLCRSGSKVDVMHAGTRFRLNLGDNRSEIKALVQGADFMAAEREEIQAVARNSGSVNIVDIGANAGLFSAIALSELGDRICLLAVEPSPLLLERLDQNIAFNSKGAIVHIQAVAIGAEEGILKLAFQPDDLGGASLAEGHNTGKVKILDVPVRPLSQLLSAAGFQTIDILKIDVEGYEDQALIPFFETAEPALWPQTVLMEVAHAKSWKQDVLTYLTDKGYRVKRENGPDIILTRQTGT